MGKTKKISSTPSVRIMSSRETFDQILCETFLVSGFSSFSALMEIHADYSKRNPECSVILTLDDRNQLEYMAAHSSHSRDLDDDSEFDESLSELNPMPPEFFKERLRRFMEKASNANFTDACKSGLQLEEDEHYVLAAFAEDPLQFLDDEVAMIIVPNTDAALGFCAVPVGYFSGDLGPFENYALAKHFEDNYGYRLIGIGTCMLGFLREKELSDDLITALVSDLTRLYHCEEISDFAEVMESIVREDKHLFIKYAESID